MTAKTETQNVNLLWAVAAPFLTIFMILFSRYLPPLTAFCFGDALYTPAWFTYDANPTFDDGWLTWGTDYLICFAMAYGTYRIVTLPRTQANSRIILASALLIGSYAGSTLSGAICHQFLAGDLNALVFRVLWRVCVGCVAVGGGLMGSAASEIAGLKLGKGKNDSGVSVTHTLSVVPHFVWVVYGAAFLIANTVGYYSMKQPACDIFCLGVSQTPSTLYLVAAVRAKTPAAWEKIGVDKWAQNILVFGAVGNLILLPAYDVMNYMQLCDGVCNLFLHTNLLVAWGAQAYGLWSVCRGAARVAH